MHIFIDYPIYDNGALGLAEFRQKLPEKMKTRFQCMQTLQNITIESNINVFTLFYCKSCNKCLIVAAKEILSILFYHETIPSIMTMLFIRH